MSIFINDPLDLLKQKTIRFILGVMAFGGILATTLHLLDPGTHPISLVLPPLTTILCVSLLIYLQKHPYNIYLVVRILLGWSGFIMLFPDYFFVVEAWLDPHKRLVDTFPPILSGIFLLTTAMIVFLRPRGLVNLALLLWGLVGLPVVLYLIFHLPELETPRGLDLMVSLVPAMGINLALILFYSRVQDEINKLYIERFYLKEVSEKDALTKVFNRGAGERILQNLLDQTERKIGIILLDVDHFKQVNDNYGHLLGDRVLQTLARSCQAQLRKQDVLIRWGGEEFLIVVTGDDEQELHQLAERLRSTVAEQQIPEVGKVTASFGVGLLQPHEDLMALFDRTDQALYRAKGLGRNQVVAAW